VIHAVPPEYASKLEPAQIYHEMLDYRWYRSEAAGHEIPLLEATQGYVRDVMSKLPDEELTVGRMAGEDRSADTETIEAVDDDVDDRRPTDPWETPAENDPVGTGVLTLDMLRKRAEQRGKPSR